VSFDGCRIRLAGVKPISQSWNLLHRRGIRFVVVEDSSSLSNLLRCHWIFVVVESASLTLNLSYPRRSCVVEPTFLVSNLGVAAVALWYYFVVCYCGPAFGTRLVSGTEGMREQKRATTNVVARVFLMHFVGHGRPEMLDGER